MQKARCVCVCVCCVQVVNADSFSPVINSLLEERDLGLLLSVTTLLQGVCVRNGAGKAPHWDTLSCEQPSNSASSPVLTPGADRSVARVCVCPQTCTLMRPICVHAYVWQHSGESPVA